MFIIVKASTLSTKRRLSSKAKFALVMVLPTFIIFVLLTVVPLFEAIYTSFTNWSGTTLTKTFIGLRNYKFILADEIFQKAIVNDFIITLGKEVLIMVFAVFFAIALTKFRFSKRESGIYRFIFFIPNILSIIIIAVLWAFIYNPSIGLVNGFLKSIGLDKLTHAWLGEYETVKPAIIIIASWAGIGFFMLILIAAINDVDNSLYEAASIDGAGEWKQLWSITIPLIWNQIQFCFITIMLTSLVGNFAIIMPMTRGGPDNASMVMTMYMYKLGITDHRVGYANAVAVILLIITAVASFVTQKLSNRKEDDGL